MMFLLIFAMIYGGVMFIDYMNLNNDARALARRIAVADTTAERQALLEKYSANSSSLKRFYDIKMTADYNYADNDTTKPIDAVVTVTFDRDNTDLPWIVYKVGFPPKHFEIQYKMKLEKISS